MGAKNYLQHYYRLLLTVLSLSVTSASTLLAQDLTPQVITTNSRGDQPLISSDSNYYIEFSIDKWIKHDVKTAAKTITKLFPLSTPLSLAEHELFMDAEQTMIYESPNHRYVVYATPSKDDGRQRLALGDRKRLQKYVFEDFVIHDAASTFSFYVNWSANNTAFLAKEITNYGSEANYVYVTNFSSDLSDVESYDPYQLQIATLKNVYDLSSDGELVLVLNATYDSDDPNKPTQYNLSVWSPKHTEASINIDTINASEIINASFAHDNDNHLLIATQTAFIEYDLTTQRQQTLLFPFDLAQVESLLFAPNGEYLITNIANDDKNTIYLVPLPLPRKKA